MTTQDLCHGTLYEFRPQDSTPYDSFLAHVAECLVLRDCSSPNELTLRSVLYEF
ncbi:hypothetical protein CY34DRAFT_808356 [Suillus luteus UH-Slu-Lm8-n1]|uniref:Uncharacterized protein n=1 Tax=Suillus luteus UH-Slu-Lm8-n1 TaxID=930992 RepID=A0A0C9ZP18_9AGAM|nr:hypothetical protein CY34DRAFT_808356 [Suillus luteus UH-Slu-Lm8-n1]